MAVKAIMKISKGGQVSIPAAIRHRWGTSTVRLDDQGDRIALQPAPDDPIATAEGALVNELKRLSPARLRRTAREDERRSEPRRRS
jgi:bifunctional DNA-binding transcriptional regulator/antitoxin component of YhaV-PrlF toxin-antitoxin module